MSIINEYFLEAYTPPRLIKSERKLISAGDVSKHLKSRQTIRLTQDEMAELTKDKSFWFYESDAEMYNNLKSMTKMFEDSEFDNIEDGYGVSEYIGVHEKYLPSLEYLQYTAMNNLDVVINVYDAYSLYDISKRNEILRNKIVGQLLIRHDDTYNQDIPEFEFKVPSNIRCTKFIEKKYEHDVFVSCFQDPVHILSVNIPYNFYAYQPLPHNVYTWDIDTKEHKFGSMNAVEFNELLNDICVNGIKKPLFMRMDGEVLSSVDDETNMIIFIAKLLKLPSIPVNIYLSNEEVGKNHIIDAVINDTKNRQSIYKNIGFMKNIFEPYVIIHKPDENISSDNINKYTVFSNNNHLVIRYLTSDIIENTTSISNEEITSIHKEMHNKEVESINSDINKIINKLLNK